MTIKLYQKLNVEEHEFILLLISKMDIENDQMDFGFIRRFSGAFRKLDLGLVYDAI
jgi:hypothetical protein